MGYQTSRFTGAYIEIALEDVQYTFETEVRGCPLCCKQAYASGGRFCSICGTCYETITLTKTNVKNLYYMAEEAGREDIRENLRYINDEVTWNNTNTAHILVSNYCEDDLEVNEITADLIEKTIASFKIRFSDIIKVIEGSIDKEVVVKFGAFTYNY